MGWSICMATERDPEKVTWLSRSFSYQLLEEYGCLRAFITEQDVERLWMASFYSPAEWEERDAESIREILERVLLRLRVENERLPIDHFLSFVDEEGKQWNASTQITIPFGGIELTYPHDPIIKLDGSHGEIDHRHELRRYRVRVDPVKLEAFMARILGRVEESGLEGNVTLEGPLSGYGDDPLVEEPDGWVPVEPVLNILGQRLEVKSMDALASYGPDLTAAIDCCKQAMSEGLPLFWLSG
jgi:hypothetical protein